MTKRFVLKMLRYLQQSDDTEVAHDEADKLLIAYINDPLIKKEYDRIKKWYA